MQINLPLSLINFKFITSDKE